MERLVALAAGVSGLAAFFALLWAMLLERRLEAAGKKEGESSRRILELESANALAELKLSETRKKLFYFEDKELKSQKDGISSLVGRARKTISLCIPEIDELLEAALKRTNAKAKIITAQPHTGIEKAEMRTLKSIDLTLVLIDGLQGHLLENNQPTKLSRQKLAKAMAGFATLWESAQP